MTSALAALGEENKKVDSYRAAFEKRMNAELDAHGKKARELRKSYLEALKRLKVELGRDNKLKEAAQVVAEIEAVEDGEEAKPLPKDADYCYQRVRKKWDDGLAAISAARGKKIKTTVELYLKALDGEKRKLTRAGKIKEALLFEEEEMRVGELPEVKAVMAAEEDPKEDGPKLETLLPGRRYSYRREEAPNQTLTLTFSEEGLASILPGTEDVRWKTTGENKITLSHPKWSTTVDLVFARNGKSFSGKVKARDQWRRGRLLGAEK